MLLKKPLPRRTVLRGLLNGAAVGVALPFLDVFLDEHGTALASGEPLPLRFGTWYWGCGLTPGQAVTERSATGPGIQFLTECAPLQPYAEHINFFSSFNTPLDGLSNYVHHSGWVASRTGTAPAVTGEIPTTTFDLLIADAIGGGTRFRNLDLVSMGNPKISYTARNTYSRSAAEASPLGLYVRVFGSGFADPRSTDFHPDPQAMVRQSVLSAVTEESRSLKSQIGHADQMKLDEYFTSIRELENQLDVQLRKPEVGEACAKPAWVDPDATDAPHEIASASFLEVETVKKTHDLLTSILVMALACNQTRVFNMVYSDAFSGLHKAGDSNTHHTLTHEEETDPKLGYQPEAFWFNCRNMMGCAAFIEAFTKVREGDRTLLDNTLIFASSETSYARMHSINNLPMMTFGSGGGRIKTGLHVIGNGDPVTRVGLTVMRALGLPIEHWGTRALGTSKVISEVLV